MVGDWATAAPSDAARASSVSSIAARGARGVAPSDGVVEQVQVQAGTALGAAPPTAKTDSGSYPELLGSLMAINTPIFTPIFCRGVWLAAVVEPAGGPGDAQRR